MHPFRNYIINNNLVYAELYISSVVSIAHYCHHRVISEQKLREWKLDIHSLIHCKTFFLPLFNIWQWEMQYNASKLHKNIDCKSMNIIRLHRYDLISKWLLWMNEYNEQIILVVCFLIERIHFFKQNCKCGKRTKSWRNIEQCMVMACNFERNFNAVT